MNRSKVFESISGTLSECRNCIHTLEEIGAIFGFSLTFGICEFGVNAEPRSKYQANATLHCMSQVGKNIAVHDRIVVKIVGNHQICDFDSEIDSCRFPDIHELPGDPCCFTVNVKVDHKVLPGQDAVFWRHTRKEECRGLGGEADVGR